MTYIAKDEAIRQSNNTYFCYRKPDIILNLYKFDIASFVYGELNFVENDGVRRGIVNILDAASFPIYD